MNYAKLLPIGSYIDALNQSPKNLAHFLRYLDKNEELYNNYFKVNRVEGEKIKEILYCFEKKVSKDLFVQVFFEFDLLLNSKHARAILEVEFSSSFPNLVVDVDIYLLFQWKADSYVSSQSWLCSLCSSLDSQHVFPPSPSQVQPTLPILQSPVKLSRHKS